MNYNIYGKQHPVTACLIFFIYFIFSLGVKAQYEELRDKIAPLKPTDRSRVFLSHIEDNKVKEPPFVGFYDYFENFAKSKNDQLLLKEIAFIRQKTKTVLRKEGEERVKELQRLIVEYEASGDFLFVGYCHYFIAQTQFEIGEYGASFENSFIAMEIFDSIGYENVPVITRFLHDLALNYYFFRDYEEVIRLMRISIPQPLFGGGIHMQQYNNMAMSYFHLGIKDSAKYYMSKTYELAEQYNSEVWKEIVSANLGDFYYEDKNYTEALKYYRKTIEHKGNEITPTIRFNSYVNMAKVYLKLDSISKGKEFLNIATQNLYTLQPFYLGEKQQIEKLKSKYFEVKIHYLTKTGSYKEALLYKDSLLFSQNFLDSKYNSATAKMSSDKLLIQKKDLKLVESQKEKANQRLFYIILISVILILGGAVYFYMYVSKLKKKRQSERLIAANRITILEKQKAEKELKTAKIEIDFFVSRINEHSQIVSKLEEDLNQLKNLELEEKNQINLTLNNLKSAKILTDEDWVDFQDNFDKVFPDFRDLLQKEFFITTSEMRYFMLVKLNFSHKEMARALGISDTAIRVTWSRIRKKLGGTPEDTPTILLNRIIQPEEQLQMS